MRSVSVANRQKQEKGQRNLAQAGRQVRIAGAFLLLIMLLLLSLIWSICSGSVSVPIMEFLQELREPKLRGMAWTIIWEIRLPRALAALILGGALALSGYLLQTFFHNPIAGPFVLGISSGSKLLVALVMVGFLEWNITINSGMLVAAAFAGALLSMLFVLLVARKMEQMAMLIVGGVMIGYICSAITDFVVTFASDADIVNLHNWSRGSFSGMTWENVAVMVGVTFVSAAAVFLLSKPVGATINIMMAATLAEGETIIENPAKEPHVVDVANFLNSMGANVKGAGTDVIRIRGVHKLHGTEYSIIPDQIEAGTFMCAAAITRGDVMVQNVIPKHLEAISAKLIEMGCEVTEFDEAVRVVGRPSHVHTDIKTLPYPGFPTDMQPQITVTLALAEGTSVVTESIFENRFKYVDELARMGGRIKVEGNTAIITGVKKLTGAQVEAPDLRAGACGAGSGRIYDR